MEEGRGKGVRRSDRHREQRGGEVKGKYGRNVFG